MSKTKVLICPYCGDTQGAGERCKRCGGLFEALSRQATHNAMGPWFVRDEKRPFQPGASYETIVRLIERNLVNKFSIIRGPTTKQFWTVAKRVPGISHLLGYCHNCDASVDPGDHGCHSCGVPFGAYMDRNFLGLPDIRPLPWELGGNDRSDTAMPSRTMDFRRAAEPLGISSFASDDELRGAGMSPMSSFGYAQPQTMTMPVAEPLAAETRPSMQLQQGVATSNSGETSESLIAARSLQRRLTEQQRTIRLLVGGMCVLAVLIVVSLAALIAAKRGGAATPGANPPVDRTKAQLPTTTPAVSQSVGTETKPDVTPQPAASPPATVPDSNQTLVEPEQASNSDSDYQRVQELIAAAEKTDRPKADRIKDYQEALELLKKIEKAAWAEDRTDIAEQIARAEHEIERLRLEEFFP